MKGIASPVPLPLTWTEKTTFTPPSPLFPLSCLHILSLVSERSQKHTSIPMIIYIYDQWSYRPIFVCICGLDERVCAITWIHPPSTGNLHQIVICRTGVHSVQCTPGVIDDVSSEEWLAEGKPEPFSRIITEIGTWVTADRENWNRGENCR